jgi:hypothetical protein
MQKLEQDISRVAQRQRQPLIEALAVVGVRHSTIAALLDVLPCRLSQWRNSFDPLPKDRRPELLGMLAEAIAHARAELRGLPKNSQRVAVLQARIRFAERILHREVRA